MAIKRSIGLVLILTSLVVHVIAGEADKPFTNADVLALVEAGLDAELVIAKIQQAPVVHLDVSGEELVRLSKRNVPKPILNAMIQRMNKNVGGPGVGGIPPHIAQSLPHYAAPARRVEIVVGDEKLELAKKNGEISAAGFMVWGTVWLNIPEPHSTVRIAEKSPIIRVFRDSAKSLSVVRLEANRKDRSLQLPSITSGRSVHAIGQPPHPESVVTSEFVENSPGVWDAKLVKPLSKGEYAVFENGFYMYDFGID
jgi:hypothetical protein